MSYLLPPQVVRTSNPTTTDDASAGFAPGYTWANSVARTVYYCISSAIGAAVWVQIGVTLVYASTGFVGTDNLGTNSEYGSYTTAAGSIV